MTGKSIRDIVAENKPYIQVGKNFIMMSKKKRSEQRQIQPYQSGSMIENQLQKVINSFRKCDTADNRFQIESGGIQKMYAPRDISESHNRQSIISPLLQKVTPRCIAISEISHRANSMDFEAKTSLENSLQNFEPSSRRQESITKRQHYKTNLAQGVQ